MRKYKFKIKKENERCLEFLVEDHDPETESIKFTIPLAFQVNEDQDGGSWKPLSVIIIPIQMLFSKDGVEYRVNVYSLAEHEGMVVESEPCHVKVNLIILIII